MLFLENTLNVDDDCNDDGDDKVYERRTYIHERR